LARLKDDAVIDDTITILVDTVAEFQFCLRGVALTPTRRGLTHLFANTHTKFIGIFTNSSGARIPRIAVAASAYGTAKSIVAAVFIRALIICFTGA